MKSAWQVGTLVVIFFGLIIAATAVLQAGFFREKYDLYYAEFTDVAGLTVGSSVLIAGVKSGEVSDVVLSPKGTALVSLNISRGVVIPVGSTATVPTSLISVGDRQVILNLGSSSDQYQSGNKDNPIPGKLSSPIDSLFPDSEKTMEELNNTLVAIQKLLGDEDLKQGLVGFMAEGQETAKKFGQTADALTRIINQNTGKVDRMMGTVASSLENLFAVSQKVREIAEDPRYLDSTSKLLENLNAAAEEGTLLVKDLRSITNDPEMRARLDKTLANFETMSESGTKVASNMEQITANGIEISAQTKELLAKANDVAVEIEETLKELKKKVGEFIDGGGVESLLPSVGAQADLVYQADPAHLRTDLDFSIGLGSDTLHFGFYDAFEANKLNLMIEKPISEQLDLRYGVYASKPGIGVNYLLAPNLFLRSELYGLNDPRLDMRLRYDFSGGFHAWGGYDGLFSGGSPVIGIGMKR